jgi:hypothetical protein
MFERACFAAFLLGLVAFAPRVASAQQSHPGRDIVYESARNKIGLIRYCRGQGLIDQRSADVALRVAEDGLASYTAAGAPAVRRAGDKAEQDGETGILGPGGKRDIASFAVLFKTTPASLCKEWVADSLRGVKGRSLQAAAPEAPVQPPRPRPYTPPPSNTAWDPMCP